MAKSKKEFIYVVNVKNGGLYLLDTVKIGKEPGLWKTYIAPSAEEKEVVEVVEESKEDQVGQEMTRDEIKLVLKAADVDFKGNASTESLLELLEESL